MSESKIKWLLFFTMAATVPVLYYLFVVGGFLPLLMILISTLLAPNAFLFHSVHILIYGPIFYFIAAVVAKKLFRLAPKQRELGLVGTIAVFLGIGFLPIYGAGHGSIEPANLYSLYVEFLTEL